MFALSSLVPWACSIQHENDINIANCISLWTLNLTPVICELYVWSVTLANEKPSCNDFLSICRVRRSVLSLLDLKRLKFTSSGSTPLKVFTYKRVNMFTFIQPEVLPSFIADQIACPAVGNLMGNNIHLQTPMWGKPKNATAFPGWVDIYQIRTAQQKK